MVSQRTRHISAALMALSSMIPAVAAGPPEAIMVVQSAEVVSKNTQVQRFNINLPVKQEQVAMPMILKLVNGGSSGRKFAWIRLFLNSGMRPAAVNAQPSGSMIVDERSFKAGDTVTLDLTGKLSAGNNVLMVQGAGMPGAALSYELSSQAVASSSQGAVKALSITSIEPAEIPIGGVIILHGTGFDTDSSKDKVTVNNQPADVQKATATSLEVKTSSRMSPHSYSVDVTVNGVKSNSVQFTVTPLPELGSSTLASIMPGNEFEFTGSNFSKIPDKNVVTITSGDVKKTCQVLSSTHDSIKIKVPEFPELAAKIYSGVNVPADLTIEVNGVRASGSLWMSIGVHGMPR